MLTKMVLYIEHYPDRDERWESDIVGFIHDQFDDMPDTRVEYIEFADPTHMERKAVADVVAWREEQEEMEMEH